MKAALIGPLALSPLLVPLDLLDVSDVVPHPVATASAATSTGTTATERLVIRLLELPRFPLAGPMVVRTGREPRKQRGEDGPTRLVSKIRTISFALVSERCSCSVPPRCPGRSPPLPA